MATGKRLHDPVRVTRELGASVPQVWSALVANETLTSVKFGCWGVPHEGVGGKEAEFFSMALTNAQVASAELALTNTLVTASMKLPIVQKISFTYERIEWTWLEGAIAAQEDWAGPSGS